MIPLRSSERVRSTAVVTLCLIALNTAIFLYELSLSSRGLKILFLRYGVVPDQYQLIDLFTSMFLHGGWLHLIGNMWFLWVFGRIVEGSMNRSGYLALYLLSGVAAAYIHIWTNYYSRVPTVGASGAISGVMGAYLILYPRSRIVTLVPIFVFITTMQIPAAFLLLYWLAIQFFSGVGSLASERGMQEGVAWFAHVGGFIAGMLLIRLFPTRRPYREWDWD
jgi:membrane associated rhomboid family serine protease